MSGLPKKLLFVIFTEDFSWGVSILAFLANHRGWDVDILFLAREDDAAVRFVAQVEAFHPTLVAVSFMSYDRRQAFVVARLARQMGIKVIAGGVHATFLPQDVVAGGLFDAVVVGDGMGVWESLLEGVSQLEGGRQIEGRRHGNRELYTSLFHSERQVERMVCTKSAMLLSSQGCPYRCRFCASGALQYIGYTPREIVGMMDQLHLRHGVRNFQFFDDLFAVTARRCKDIHKAVLEHFGASANIRFGNFVQARVNTFNEEIAEALVSMGIGCVNFGIETASDRLLGFLNKKQTQADCYRAMRICRDFGLVRKVNLMFGIPTQTSADYEASLRFVQETNPEITTCFFFVPLPGSDLYDYCFDQGYFPADCDRDRFDWFDDRPDGFVEIQYRLRHIDYDLAVQYKNRIEQVGDQVEALHHLVRVVDQCPWVVIGTSKAYYYKRFLERLSSATLTKCLGYVDLEAGGGFRIPESVKIRKYDLHSSEKPKACVTYCYVGGEDFAFMRRAVDQQFGNIPLVSLASYRNHSKGEIEELLRGDPSGVCPSG